jgi:shikimate dehydrogenase
MNKKFFAIIGKPLSHSLSPALHNFWLKENKIDGVYDFFEIDENEIENVLGKVRNKEIDGINVTLPYKQKVIPFLDSLSDYAKESHSVNTIYLDDNNQLIGDNTDIYGIQEGYLKKIITKKNKELNILIIGAGGVSPSIIVSLQKFGINKLSLVNRTYEKSTILKKQFPKIELLKWENYKSKIKYFDIIINATSLGLKNGESFDSFFENFKDTLIYIDTIYNPLETEMIKYFKENKIKTYNGFDMFIYQGQKSFNLWNKITPRISNEVTNLLISKLK